MNQKEIVEYFESQAKTGTWNSLYDPGNPLSYPFIIRFRKAIGMLQPLKNKTVVDLGCGTGILIPYVSANDGYYTGVDVSENMLNEIRKNQASFMQNGKVKLMLGDLNHIDLPNADVAIGLGFIEYFDNPDEVVETLYKKVTPGGQLVLSFPNFNSLDYWLLSFFAPFRFLARKLSGKSTPQPPRKLWNVSKAKELFTRHGFENIRVMNYNVNIFTYPFTRISLPFTNYWAEKLEYSFLSQFSWFASGFIVSGTKPLR